MTALTSAPPVVASDKNEWTLAAMLRGATAEHPDRVCIRTMTGEALTYHEVLAHSETRAAGLSDLGVGPGDRVVLVMDNSIEMVLTWFGINLLGAVEVPSNTANRGRSLEHVLNNSGATLAVVDAHYAELLNEVADNLAHLQTVLVNGAAPMMPWPSRDLAGVRGDPTGLPATPATYRDPAAIMYTSGTTGPAKGVVVPHGHMYTFAAHVVQQLRITRDDVYYVCLPLFHGNAQFMQVYAALIADATIVLAETFSASGWIHDINKSGATVTSLLGVMAQYIHNQPTSELDNQHTVSRMVTIPLPAAIAEDFERRFATTCVEAYGMTEVCLPLYRPLDEPLRPGSCGKPLADWFDVAIVDPETDEPLPDGQVGEIVVRPHKPFTTFTDYHDMPERTVEAWRNLWFHTGDAGKRDTDGYYYFVDRLNDRIRRKGENLTTYDIEIALIEIPTVVDAAVVAKPATEGEDDVKAYVVMASEAQFDPVEILRHCAARLPYFAVPRYLEPLPELPKTPNGKILKRELRTHNGSDAEWDRERAGYTVRRNETELASTEASSTDHEEAPQTYTH